MKFDPVQIVTNGDMSGTLTINSAITDLNQQYVYSIQAVYSGTPVGSLKLQASNDIVTLGAGGGQPAITNWTDISGSTVGISAAGNYLWNVSNFGYRWTRLVYTQTSGTGTLNVVLNAKGA